MSELKKIVALLAGGDVERRVAAAVVLGAIGAKDKETTAALEKLLAGSPEEQRAALDAFAALGPKRVLAKVFELLANGTPHVRDAAFRALKAAGADVVDDIRARREKAGEAEKQRLDRVLAELGGADAFKALLEGLASADEQTARAAALSVRERVAAADARTRRSYGSAVLKALTAKRERTAQQETALLKILGWCEDEVAVPLLLEVAADAGKAAAVRSEAIIALRFALAAGAADKSVVGALLDVAAGADSGLARTAIDTLAGLNLDDKAAPKLVVLAQHRDPVRARFAVDKLKAQGGQKAAAALVDVVLAGDKNVSEAAAEALSSLPEATAPALEALLTSKGDAVRLLVDVLKPRAGKLPKGAAKKLLDVVTARLVEDGRNYESCLAVARAADADGTAAALRELAARLKKQKKDERAEHVLRLLTNSGGATVDDRVRLALLALQKSRLDARPDARARDEALKAFSGILGSVDVMKVLKKDKHVTAEQLFFLGFHFAEEGEPIGEQLLREVIARGPRTKLAKAAKNKLALEAAT